MKLSPLLKSILSVRTFVLALGYLVMLFLSYYLAFETRFDFVVPPEFQSLRWKTVTWVLPLEMVLLYAFGQFCGFLSFFRLPDVLRIFGALAVTHGFLLLMWFLYEGQGVPPRGTIVMNFLFALMTIIGFRVLLRMYRERYLSATDQPPKTQRVAIVGAGDAGSLIVSDLLARRGLGMRPVIFLDDDPEKVGLHVHGVLVADRSENMAQAVRKYGVQKVIVALPSASRRRVREIVQLAARCGVEAEIVPSLRDLTTGTVKATDVRPVELEDLLGREPVRLDTEQIAEMAQGKIVMVTGAGGSIGSELCRQIAFRRPGRLLMVEQSEVQLFPIQQEMIKEGYGALIHPLIADITDHERMVQIFEKFKPQIIFHAAAHKHVYMMEIQPGEAVKNNSIGSYRLARMAGEYGVERFVLISTDKAINPTSVMGASKRLAEMCVQALQSRPGNRTQYMAVRFGNVLGSSGSVIPIFKKQIAEGGPVTVTHPDVTRYFMTIPEAVGLVLQCATLGKGGEIFVLDMGQPIRIVDVARQLIELSGLRPDVDIEIKFIGLRPGEKLFEELQHRGEKLTETAHPRILRLLADPVPLREVESWIGEAQESVHELERDQLKRMLNKFIPEYVPHLE